MAPPINLSLPQLRLPPLSSRRLLPIQATFSHHNNFTPKPRTLYPRDLRIDFGRHKGRMLGTLPSSYLKWLSNCVDPDPSFSYWSKLAKQVLEDPVYRDRIEWEPAHRLFSGVGLKGTFFSNESFSVLDAYREIGERFGWDMEDKEAWSKVNRDLIGTSFSGRIPRKKRERSELGVSESVKRGESDVKGGSFVSGMRGEMIERVRKTRDDGFSVDSGRKVGFLVGKKRGERIERMRLRREKNAQTVKSNQEPQEVLEEKEEEEEEEAPKIKIKKERFSRKKRVLERRNRELGDELDDGMNNGMINLAKREEKTGNAEIFNPFPGRDSLLERIRRKKD